ncbi:MAG: hypothetical protein IH991_23635, partial [Planctomycetes bacterium]|nr:hypothetical protein [Planctomycetota bacterium]
MKRFVIFALPLVALCFASIAKAQQAPSNFPGLGPRGTLTAIEFEKTGDIVLSGPNSRQQLLAVAKYSSNQLHDVTHDVTYQLS